MTGSWCILARFLMVAGPLGASALVYGAVTLPAAPAPVPTAAETVRPVKAVEEPAIPAPFRLAALRSFGDMVERPMFTLTRRPYVADAPPPPPPAAAPPQPEFRAVVKAIILAQDGRMSLIGRTGQKGTQLVTEGEDVDGWTVSSITQDAVLFRAGTRELRLYAAQPVQGAVTWGTSQETTSAP
ncbi:MAG TPA: hypothetical protein VD978_29395 [Azospirillum sp.]|nr:hypothetical protein [Azospirillum sp.]